MGTQRYRAPHAHFGWTRAQAGPILAPATAEAAWAPGYLPARAAYEPTAPPAGASQRASGSIAAPWVAPKVQQPLPLRRKVIPRASAGTPVDFVGGQGLAKPPLVSTSIPTPSPAGGEQQLMPTRGRGCCLLGRQRWHRRPFRQRCHRRKTSRVELRVIVSHSNAD